ncbi:MAG: MBL fold metallo-hydrolase [Candidatus Omnitrophica bacterium]|nr:MBL fold metallo-hydrolase [Candidatus Omnitrophota bacterium]
MDLPEQLILKQFEIGPLNNFLYFVGDVSSGEIAVVDPAWDVDFLCRQAQQMNYCIVAVFLTHGHPDHVNGLDKILSRHDVPAYISRHEPPFLTPKHKNIVTTEDGQILKVGSREFRCLLTPGHTPGCQSFLYENVMICGDAIFVDGCGRCDLPGGDASVMYDTLYNIIMPLPDDTVIFPGHNYGPTPCATLASQKRTNPYLTCRNREEFLVHRMGYAA